MTLGELSKVGLKKRYSNHTLQACQSVAVAMFADGSQFVGIYDASNGHWLNLPDLDEIGYCADVDGKRAVAYFEITR